MMNLLIEQSGKGESAQVLLRTKLRAVSRRMGFSDMLREHMELVCNEAITNQNKYAQGQGLVQIWEVQKPYPALDVFAMDYGAGVANLAAAMRDGYTTAGTLGKGLGAIQRLASESALYSVAEGRVPETPWHGLAVWARFTAVPPRENPPHQFGSFVRAYRDDIHNGDLLCLERRGDRTRWLHLDGLGHGQEAAAAVDKARDMLGDDDMPLDALMQAVSQRLAGTRGAVGMASELDTAKQTLTVCGAGDIGIYLISNGVRQQLPTAGGILGHVHGRLEPLTVPFPRHALLITASDGMRETWGLRAFPELWRLHPQLIALILGQVMGRNNDDKSILVIRAGQQQENDHGN
jgi:anti-sigma regulatory factor (Ser/Thr protein kinase)